MKNLKILLKKKKVYLNETSIDELKNFILSFSNFLAINDSEKMYDILSFLTKKFKTKDLIVIYIEIINKESSSFELRKKFIYDLVNKTFKEKIETYEILEDLYEKLNKNEDIETFFTVINKNNVLIKKVDFLKKHNEPIIIFYYKMVVTENYKERMYNYPFFQKNNQIIKNIYLDIIELKIKFNELENLYNLNKDNKGNERIYLLCEGDKDLMNELRETIYFDISRWFERGKINDKKEK